MAGINKMVRRGMREHVLEIVSSKEYLEVQKKADERLKIKKKRF